ncbi:DUF3048 domain-containing protein [Nocardia flavorosea]|uniref:DUF3048 domain-containing protein n=1 Tax=Nocardia TaxID=1817 RepID=UPI0018936CA7|nr:DUF3048 domain-containing protein [Nocardia flavorosea]
MLVAKVDNSPDARPPAGLAAADMVCVEPVEGGLSRLAAVFSADKPPLTGPVRSTRETDLTLLTSSPTRRGLFWCCTRAGRRRRSLAAAEHLGRAAACGVPPRLVVRRLLRHRRMCTHEFRYRSPYFE